MSAMLRVLVSMTIWPGLAAAAMAHATSISAAALGRQVTTISARAATSRGSRPGLMPSAAKPSMASARRS